MSRVWFVTGSSRGLGRAIVETALEAGDRVVATARKPEQLDDLAARHGDRVLAVALDVTDSAAVERAVQQGFEKFGHYDVVVNNAGYADLASVEDTTLESFRAQIEANFLGLVSVTKAVLPILRKQGSGHVFQVSSLGGRLGTPGLGAYQSAKWAIGGFSTVLAKEVAPLGIQVTVLEPGGMRTDWAGPSMTIPPISEPYRQTVGAVATGLASVPDAAETDPAKVARLIGTLAGRADAPVRLVLGAQAYRMAQDTAHALAESDATWRELSESVVG